MPSAGMLRDRATFSRLDTTADAYGNESSGAFANLFTVWADLKLERGREQLAAGRLQGSTAGILTVRSSSNTRSVTTEDKVTIGTVAYNIRSNVPRDRNGFWLEMVVESGVAV